MAEVNEVGPPSTRVPAIEEFDDQAAPTFQMSEAGKALREQMDKAAGKAPGSPATPSPFPTREQADADRAAAPTEPPTVKDGEGHTLDLTTGKTTPGAPAPEIHAELSILPSDVHADAEQYATDMQALVQGEGIEPDRGQAVFDAIADLHMSNDHTLAITTPDAATGVLTNRYGAEEARKLVADAQAMARQSPALWRYLNDTGAGNSPAVLLTLALAQRGQLRVSAEQAAAKVKELAGDNTRLGIDTRRVLARLAQGRKDPQPQYSTSGQDKMYGVGPKSKDELRAELAALNAPDADTFSSDGPRRKRAVTRRAQIIADLGGNA